MLLPVLALAACSLPPKQDPPETHAFDERELTFDAGGGIELEGTLTVPEGDGPRPAVLLLPGSGPTDRNGNQAMLRTDLLLQIAHDLATHGIASFRFDKRAAHASRDQWPQDPAGYGAFFSWSNHVKDVALAFEFMRSLKHIDPGRTGIVGHSEGATLASVVAAQKQPKALVMISGPGRQILEILDEQIGAQVERLGMPNEEAKELIAESRRVAEYIRTKRAIPDDVPPLLAALYNPSVATYMAEWLDIDPLALVRQCEGSLLIVNGDMDIQISAERDALALYESATKRESAYEDLAIIRGASHNLKGVETILEPGFSGPVVPEALAVIRRFLKGRL